MLRQGRAASRLWCDLEPETTGLLPSQPQRIHAKATECDNAQHNLQQLVCQQKQQSQQQNSGAGFHSPAGLSSSCSSTGTLSSARHYGQWSLQAEDPTNGMWTVIVLLLLAGIASWTPTADAMTNTGDKAALLSFKSSITSDAGLLRTWSASTDPCGDGNGRPWVGISCNCSGSLPGDYDLLCGEQPAPPLDDGSRVLALNFGDILISEGRKLTGQISPDLDQLTQLRLLNLRQNQLSVRVQIWRQWHTSNCGRALYSALTMICPGPALSQLEPNRDSCVELMFRSTLHTPCCCLPLKCQTYICMRSWLPGCPQPC